MIWEKEAFFLRDSSIGAWRSLVIKKTQMIFGNLVNLIEHHWVRCMKAAKAIDDNGLRILDDFNSRPPGRKELEDEGSMIRIVVSSCQVTCYIELSDLSGNA